MLSRQVELAAVQSKITSWLQDKMPRARNLSVSTLQRSNSGISNETFLFNLGWEEAGRSRSAGLVLRCAPQAYPVYPQYDLRRQFAIMKRLHRTKIPVPKVYWLEDDEGCLGTSFYLMGKLDGFVLPEYPPYHTFGPYFEASPKQRAEMWWRAVEVMARIHSVDWMGQGLSFISACCSGFGAVRRELAYYEMYLKWVDEGHEKNQPILTAALHWLKENCYEPEHVALVWGDCRLPNMMYSQEGEVVGVLDWEMAYIGDPEADLAFFLFGDWQHSEGYGIPRLEGAPSYYDTVRRYEDLTGRKVEHLLYNEVWAAFRAGVVQLKVFKNFKAMGVPLPSEGIEVNNPCTQRLAALLGLPVPGPALRETTDVENVTATVQFRITGLGGGDWYIVAEKGRGSRHEGMAQNPNITLTASSADWAAIRRGELDRTQAWLGGKIKIEGDMPLMLQLEDMISRLTQ
jgi:aminoglycoside phosphotransferase (APT) family kinase protein/putative sterol carrier protein